MWSLAASQLQHSGSGWGCQARPTPQTPHHPGPLLPSPSPRPGEEGESKNAPAGLPGSAGVPPATNSAFSPLSPGRREGDGREGVGGVRGRCYTPPASRSLRAAQSPSGGDPEDISEDIVLKIHEYQAKEILRRYGVA